MKYTIGEIVQNRKVGTIGKYSTYDDMVKEFGEPSFVRHDGLAYYGNLVFQFMLRKKLILGISITSSSKESRRKSGWGNNTILKDFNRFNKLDIEALHNYFKEFNVEFYSEERFNFVSGNTLKRYISKHNKFYTIFEPKYEMYVHLIENRFYEIDLYFNYRSKRRN